RIQNAFVEDLAHQPFRIDLGLEAEGLHREGIEPVVVDELIARFDLRDVLAEIGRLALDEGILRNHLETAGIGALNEGDLPKRRVHRVYSLSSVAAVQPPCGGSNAAREGRPL